ncbi:Serine phosphatase RsbU, regulator of sigma subunit [Desulfovibrio sp. DV]|uniref:SpoIIE family protein phosphatase n=1 Tax=Desulfovibrio sp. DV TaxID=1844708 RepID=UPI00094BA72C|nr:SpoIIE family protein phosphatase [Desulfovibrio sp. DV]OLN25656.1 Serine phosphatase RsbU, regulator of sigma subunit [Desulfovibrio sp. DV]
MLRMAVGHANCLDAGCAIRGAVESCRRGLGGVEPAGLLLFAGVSYDHDVILQAVAAAFPGVPLVGGTSSGELSSAGGVTDDSVLLIAFGGEGIACTAGVARDYAGPGADVSAQAAAAVAALRPGFDRSPGLCLVFPDGGRGGVQDFCQSLTRELGEGCLVFGGTPGRHLADRRPVRQFFGREVLIHAAPFLLFSGPIPLAMRLSRGWRPLGGLARVTGVDGNVVSRIGERSALDFYRHYLGPHAEPAVELPLAVACEKHKDFILRAPAFFSEGDGSIQFPAGVPEGAMVQLAEANRTDMLADIKTMAKGLAGEVAAGAAGDQPAGVLLFSCSTRKDILGTKAVEEIDALAEALPAGTPLAGFYCHGEIAPSAPGLPLHLQNGSLVALLLGGEVPAASLSSAPADLPCPAGETEALERANRSLTRALSRATESRERLEAQKDRSQALMRVINDEINTARLEIQRKNELLRQALALAEEVQRNLLPQAAPGLPGFDIAGTSLYSDETGGDYYDFIHAPNEQPDRFGIIIGDVTGHGIAAALLMTTARAFLRMRSFQPGSLASVIDDVNKLLCADLADSGRFMTLFYLAIDVEKKRLHWVRAGHDPIILYDAATGLANDIPDKGGPPLGIVTEARYAENSAAGLIPGQVALLATDGLWEARNAKGEMFGKDRVRELLGRHSDLTAADIVTAVLEGLREFLGDDQPEDDVTLVAIKVLPE